MHLSSWFSFPGILAAGLSLGALLTTGLAMAADAQTAEHFETTVEKKLELKYLLYLPEGYDDPANADKQWPVVLFLHGAGERGDDLAKVKYNGPPKHIAQGGSYPAIVISPLCPADSWWDRHYETLLALLDQIEATHRVDPSRIYLTGLSMGGYGTWGLASQAPERFAAAVPICGGGSRGMTWSLTDMPIWVFHGEADNVVPLEESTDMVKWIKSRGGSNVKLTTYPGVGHASWVPAYQDDAMWAWLFAQRKPQPETQPAADQ